MIRRAAKSSLAALVALLALAVGTASADVPPRSPGGQTLAVPEEQLDLGDVYHVTPGLGTQLTWTADAPLARVVATCNRVVGYFVTPFDLEEGQPPLLAGALRIPVASFTTGIERLDKEFHAEPAFHLDEYPEMTLEIMGVADTRLISDENGTKAYTLNASCRFTVKDKTLDLTLPVRLTLVPFTWQTAQLGMGDALVLRAEFDVKRADLPVQAPRRPNPDFQPEADHVELSLVGNTMSPERNLFPNITHEHYRKQLRFLTLLRDFNDPEKGYEFGRAFMKEIWNDAPALNRLAGATLTEEGIKTRDLGFALKAAQRANELTESKDPALLNTLARAHYEKADLDAALNWARQAVERIEGAAPGVAAEVRAALRRYEVRAERIRE